MENNQKIQRIDFPNTVRDAEQGRYHVGKFGIVKIERIYKSGETAEGVGWFQIFRDIADDSMPQQTIKMIAEVRESICNVYY